MRSWSIYVWQVVYLEVRVWFDVGDMEEQEDHQDDQVVIQLE